MSIDDILRRRRRIESEKCEKPQTCEGRARARSGLLPRRRGLVEFLSASSRRHSPRCRVSKDLLHSGEAWMHLRRFLLLSARVDRGGARRGRGPGRRHEARHARGDAPAAFLAVSTWPPGRRRTGRPAGSARVAPPGRRRRSKRVGNSFDSLRLLS